MYLDSKNIVRDFAREYCFLDSKSVVGDLEREYCIWILRVL
jgi:hypothetical protein